jgi:hypothetical protein
MQNQLPETKGQTEPPDLPSGRVGVGNGASGQKSALPATADRRADAHKSKSPQPATGSSTLPPDPTGTGAGVSRKAPAVDPGGDAKKAKSPQAGVDPSKLSPGQAGVGTTGARGGVRRMTAAKNRWWRRTFADNFSLEHALDATIDRLRIELSTMPQAVVPAMDTELRERLVKQLDRAAELLDACEPFERVMQRINFVEAEIMKRLGDEHLDLAIEELRAAASICLPGSASKAMLDEVEKLAGSTEPTPKRKIKIVGLKRRLNASVIELFRGSERARDAIQILGVALIALTVLLGGLFQRDLNLQRSLFTHYGDPIPHQLQTAPGQPATSSHPTPPATGGDEPVMPASGAQSSPREATTTDQTALPATVQRIQFADGPSRLIDFAFPVLVMAALFGGIGACLSGLFSFTLQGRVPNEYEGWFRTLIRPVIGIASGMLAVVILRSGLTTFGDDLAWVAITALAFGFSERLFMGTMARLERLPQ